MLLACQFVPFVKFVFETKILKFDNSGQSYFPIRMAACF